MTTTNPITEAPLSTETDEIEREGPRSFGVFLHALADGEAMAACSNELHKLVSVLQDESLEQNAELKGELRLTIKVTADPKGHVAVSYDLATKEPKPVRSSSIMWITKGGNLTVENPRQQKLPLRDVDLSRRKMREPNYDEPAVKESPDPDHG